MAPALRRLAIYLPAIRKEMRSDLAIYAAVIAYLVFGTLFVVLRSGAVFGAFWLYAATGVIAFGLVMPYGAVVASYARIALRLGSRPSLAHRYVFAPGRVGRFVAGTSLMTLALVPFEAMFASIKSALPTNGRFPDDVVQADFDKFLHFGHEPWRYLYAFAKNQTLLKLVEINYDMLWFVICFGALYWVVVSRRAAAVRRRYVLSFFLTWIVVGNIFAGIFLSAGPAFYGHVTGDTARFAELTRFVASSSGWFYSAADAQAYLWALHQHGMSGFGSGISAFPSMHVALAAMNMFFAFELGRRIGLIALAYTGFIMFGSVYLGWHYAVDGYAALIVSGVVYWGVRRVLPAVDRLRAHRQAPPLSGSTPAGASADF